MRVAVVQAGSVPFDTDACVDKAVALIGEAAQSGAKVMVFPEAFIPGYPKGINYGLSVGTGDSAGREEFQRYFDAAIEVPSSYTDRLGEAAGANHSYVVMGVIERERGTCYCTVLFFGPDSALLGKHRKLMPSAMERTIWGFGDGSTLTVVDSPYGRIGSVICWENYMPMLRMAMYSKNVALYCAPMADDRAIWLPSMQHIAFEGRCFVLSACQFLRRKDFVSEVRVSLGESPDSVLMRGGSAIISPYGRVLAGPHFDGETILTGGSQTGRHNSRKVRLRCSGPLRPPRRFSVGCQRGPDACSRNQTEELNRLGVPTIHGDGFGTRLKSVWKAARA